MSKRAEEETEEERRKKKREDDGDDDVRILDFTTLGREDIVRLTNGSREDRLNATVPLSRMTKAQIRAVAPMTWFEEAVCVLFLAFVIPNGAFTIPLATFLIGHFVVGDVARSFAVLALLLMPLAILPQPHVPSVRRWWLTRQIIRYFSFRMICASTPTTQMEGDDDLDDKKQRPAILMAPPHGVFPYGNILAMLTWPTIAGSHFRGLAASGAVNVPIFKQVMRAIDVVDASRATARRALETYPYTIGISTGGVAEVFETNSENECVVLKERIGVIKLAIRTGADVVPCYLFGNTKLLNCWSGEGIPGGRTFLERISRKVGFALILIFGRFLLPIPFRKPVLGLIGKPIPTHAIQCEDPTMEQVEKIQGEFLASLKEAFDKYKGYYGWDDKELIIK